MSTASPGPEPGRRVVLLVTSPRVPAGLLTAQAWDLVRTHPVLARAENATTAALRAAGVEVRLGSVPDLRAALTESSVVIWLTGPDPDLELARAVGATAQIVYGSWDPPGAGLLDVVEVVDRLASPGGDAWLRERTQPPAEGHRQLARYLIEEAYEAFDALSTQDEDAIREEMGDVLFQVVLHARIGQEAAEPWDINDLARDLAAKLIRRNPHVFAGERVETVADIMENWDRIKREEKKARPAGLDGRAGLDGVALSQPALALAAKIISRAERRGEPAVAADQPPPANEQALGEALFALVAAAHRAGLDAEAALRRTALAWASRPAPPNACRGAG